MAIQSQGDTIIKQGIGAEEIGVIVQTLSDQIPKLAQAAAAIVEVRLKSFKEEIIERFERDSSVKSEAFSDPDFQQVLLEAQRAYARTGNTDSHTTLVDLIANRSSENTGSRRAFAINESISIVSRLTQGEIAELAFSFFVRFTQNHIVNSLPSFCEHINIYIDEFLDDIELEPQSYHYLAAQRCVTISVGSIGLLEIWKRIYPGLFFKGFDESHTATLEEEFPGTGSLLINSLFDQKNMQPRAMNLEAFLTLPRPASILEEHVRIIWGRAVDTTASDDEIIEKLTPLSPRLGEANKKWANTLIKSLELTTIGQTIGHARLTKIPAFGKPDLSIWVK